MSGVTDMDMAGRLSALASNGGPHADLFDNAAARLRGEAQAEQQAAGEAGTMPGTDGFTMACFKAGDVPVGTKLYTRPQAALSSTAATAPVAGDEKESSHAG